MTLSAEIETFRFLPAHTRYPKTAVPRSIWSGTSSFGLVDAPVPISTTMLSKELRFQFFHKALARKAS
jgi:hypothetical protein